MQNHRGVLILVFGIIGLVVCFPFGIVAWVMGNTDLKAMDAGEMDPEGRGLTQAGKIIGIIATAMTALGFIIGIGLLLLVLLLSTLAAIIIL
jgi:hypothetical protein